jgi:hypothetical protein
MFRIQSIKKKYDSRLDLHRYQLVGLHWIVVGGFLHACAGTNDEHADPYADFEFDGLWHEARTRSPLLLLLLSVRKWGLQTQRQVVKQRWNTRSFQDFSCSGQSEMSLLK